MKAFLRLFAGWVLMLAGMLVMLDANLPVSRARSRTGLAVQAVVGFALVVAGWWLRRQVTHPRKENE